MKNGRRRFLTPVPQAASYDELNARLEAHCREEWDRRAGRHTQTIGERVMADLAVFHALPEDRFDACEKRTARVSSTLQVRYRMNDYSVPMAYGYRYYVSESLIRGPRAASLNGRRLPARDVEEIALNSIVKLLQSGTSILDALSTIDSQISKEHAVARSQSIAKDWQNLPGSLHRSLVRRLVQRIVVHADHVDIEINRHQLHAVLSDPELREPVVPRYDPQNVDGYVIKVDASLRRAGQGLRMVVHDAPAAKAPSAALVNLIVKAFEIRNKILNGNGESIEAASERIKVNANYITALLRISFLAPDIVEAILDGRHPVTLTARNFSTKTHLLPRAWSLQRRHLGF